MIIRGTVVPWLPLRTRWYSAPRPSYRTARVRNHWPNPDELAPVVHVIDRLPTEWITPAVSRVNKERCSKVRRYPIDANSASSGAMGRTIIEQGQGYEIYCSDTLGSVVPYAPDKRWMARTTVSEIFVIGRIS